MVLVLVQLMPRRGRLKVAGHAYDAGGAGQGLSLDGDHASKRAAESGWPYLQCRQRGVGFQSWCSLYLDACGGGRGWPCLQHGRRGVWF